jgi:hypothetical protein
LIADFCSAALARAPWPSWAFRSWIAFLDSKGKALAATGRPLPTRFNTFFFGCGLTKQLWIPKTGGKDYEMTSQLKPLEAFRSKLNVFSGLRVPLGRQSQLPALVWCRSGRHRHLAHQAERV